MTDTRLITAAEAPALLGIPAATVRNWRRHRLITPKMIDNTGRVLYAIDEIRAIADQYHPRPTRRRHADTSAPGDR